MIQFISLFFPGVISIKILKELTKRDYKELSIYYPIYTIIINIIGMAIVCIYKNEESIGIIENFGIINFALKYLVIVTIFSILLPFIFELIKKNINIEFLIKKDNKNEKKN